MIDWMLQTTAAHPDLARGVAPAGLLCPAEQRRLEGLWIDKRRRDWLLGRWTAKRLVRAWLARSGAAPAPDALCLLSAADGAPLLELDERRLELALSISHSHGRALCALCATPGVALGVDIEYIEPRGREFALDYFSPHELALLEQAPPAARDTLVTAIWSAKEATLKALRLGLTVDTRLVTCLPRLAIDAHPGPLHPAEPTSTEAWMLLDVSCDPLLTGGVPGHFQGWWLIEDGFTLTIVSYQIRLNT